MPEFGVPNKSPQAIYWGIRKEGVQYSPVRERNKIGGPRREISDFSVGHFYQNTEGCHAPLSQAFTGGATAA